MKLNRAERWVVNNPSRVIQQWMEIQWLKGRTPHARGGNFLEVGCGRGAGGRLILRHFQPDRLNLLDLDIRMIRQARRYLTPEEKSRAFFHVADATGLPFRSSSLDAVFGFGFLHHVPRWRRALEEIARVLVPGGIYYMEELYPSLYQNRITRRFLLHPEDDRFRSEDLKGALKAAGLELKAFKELKPAGILGVGIRARK